MDSIADASNVINRLEQIYGKVNVENALINPLNGQTGYRGLHVTFNKDGVNVEVQLTTPKAWKIKKRY